MLAVAWSFGCPARFADSGGSQTRYAQTMRPFFPESAALLGHATRPGEPREVRSPFIMGPWNCIQSMKRREEQLLRSGNISLKIRAFALGGRPTGVGGWTDLKEFRTRQ